MKPDGSFEAQDYDLVKKIVQSISTRDIEEEISTFKELIMKYHPDGMRVLEDIQKVKSSPENPTYQYRLPRAIIEFQVILGRKYLDKRVQSAVFMKVMDVLYLKTFSNND